MKREVRMPIHESVNLSHDSGLDGGRASDDIKHDLPTNELAVDIYGPSYHPFVNPADYALALWFHHSKCSKGNVNQFFCDKRLAAIQ